MGYHTKNIEKGVLGEISKLEEEKEELNDNSGSKILILCELSDYYGALIKYVEGKSILDEKEVIAFCLTQDSLNLEQSIDRFNYHHNKIVHLELNDERDKIPQVVHSIVSDINSIANIFNMDIEDIRQFSKMTSKSFETGHRTPQQNNSSMTDFNKVSKKLDKQLSVGTEENIEESSFEIKVNREFFLRPGDLVIDKKTSEVGRVVRIGVKQNIPGPEKHYVEIEWLDDLEREIIEYNKYTPFSQWNIRRLTPSLGANVNKDYSIERPKHYSENDPFKIMEDNCTFEEIMGAMKLNVIKYALRRKGEDEADIKKLIHYAEWGLKQFKNEKINTECLKEKNHTSKWTQTLA